MIINANQPPAYWNILVRLNDLVVVVVRWNHSTLTRTQYQAQLYQRTASSG